MVRVMQGCCGLHPRCFYAYCCCLGLILEWTAKAEASMGCDRGLQQATGICLLPLTRQRFDVKSNMPDLLTICFYLLDIHCNTLPERHAMTFLSNEGLKILCKIFLPASSQEGFAFQNSSFLVYAGHILCHIGIAGSSVFRPKFFEGSADPGRFTLTRHSLIRFRYYGIS